MSEKNKVYCLLASPDAPKADAVPVLLKENEPLLVEQIGLLLDMMLDIMLMANKSGAVVHRHDYKDQQKNPEVSLLLECSPAFLEKIKKLESFYSVSPVTEPTVRRSQDIFNHQKAAPKNNNGPRA